MTIIEKIEREQMRLDIPAFKPGDAVKVHFRIVEGEKERIQVFQGNVIRMHRGTVGATVTVRKSPTAWAWNVSSPCTPPSSTTSSW